MEDYKHIDKILRDKFDDYAPAPPAHVWEGIENGLINKPVMWYKNTRTAITATAIIIALLTGSYYFYNNSIANSTTVTIAPKLLLTSEDNNVAKKEVPTEVQSADTYNEAKLKTENLIDLSQQDNNNEISTSIIAEENVDVPNISVIATENTIATENELSTEAYRNDIKLSVLSYNRNNFNIDNTALSEFYPHHDDNYAQMTQNLNLPETKPNVSFARWKTGVYLSPEFATAAIDSVEILNTFTLSVESSYNFNKHWFVRSGLGLSYARDRGFARMNYVTNEYMGSYDDVYDITFDTVSGDVVPVYHTKTVEVWDTVRHISVSSVTNKYLYLQVPVLVGYQWNHATKPIDFYVYAGPAFNVKVSEWIDNPIPTANDVDIISLQNNLPRRSEFYMQLWIAAGLEYELNKNISIAAEPGFRYYTNSIYKDTDILPTTSGFTLRVGLVYTIK